MRLLICGVLYATYLGLTQADDTVMLPQGRVRGINHFIDGYRSYLGIPYATVNERFQEAGDPPTWAGTFRAYLETKCKQFSQITKLIVGTENCLTANVYTPSKSSEPLPVIVFLHGGGYYWGSNTNLLYNPKYLVQKNVVVVSITYRLGAFGFLCLKTKGAPGNIGIKDQIAGLKWVKNNIAYFGGNPESVTLFGESAGGTSTTLLVLTQAAKGLFHRAIVDSGPVSNPQLFVRQPITSAVEVAGRLGYNTTDTDELLAIFRNSSADDIVAASYLDSTNDALAPYLLMLCKEDPEISENAIMTKNPQELLDSVEGVSNISIIMGYNNKEGIMWATKYNLEGLKNLDRNFTSAIPQRFLFNSEEDKEAFIEAIKEFYFNNGPTNYDGLISYYSDALIIYPSVRNMEALMSNTNITLYNYFFKYDSIRNLNKLSSNLRFTPGANHADELFYLFDPIIYQLLPSLPSDIEFVDIMTSLWTNFAKTGIPSAKNITWAPSEDTLSFLKLDKKINMIALPFADRMEFWRRAEQKYGLRYP